MKKILLVVFNFLIACSVLVSQQGATDGTAVRTPKSKI
jgi:hypothetical protein